MRILLASIVLLAASGMAHAAGNCTINLKGDDAMKFDLSTVTVSASCKAITVNLTHPGKLPAATMGHNVVIALASDMQGIANDGMKAGLANNYVKTGDTRVIAHTKVVGGGGSASTSFPGSKLKVGGDYEFFCSAPGHWAVMKGKVVVVK